MAFCCCCLTVVLERSSKTHTAKWAYFHAEPLPRSPSLSLSLSLVWRYADISRNTSHTKYLKNLQCTTHLCWASLPQCSPLRLGLEALFVWCRVFLCTWLDKNILTLCKCYRHWFLDLVLSYNNHIPEADLWISQKPPQYKSKTREDLINYCQLCKHDPSPFSVTLLSASESQTSSSSSGLQHPFILNPCTERRLSLTNDTWKRKLLCVEEGCTDGGRRGYVDGKFTSVPHCDDYREDSGCPGCNNKQLLYLPQAKRAS